MRAPPCIDVARRLVPWLTERSHKDPLRSPSPIPSPIPISPFPKTPQLIQLQLQSPGDIRLCEFVESIRGDPAFGWTIILILEIVVAVIAIEHVEVSAADVFSPSHDIHVGSQTSKANYEACQQVLKEAQTLSKAILDLRDAMGVGGLERADAAAIIARKSISLLQKCVIVIPEYLCIDDAPQ